MLLPKTFANVPQSFEEEKAFYNIDGWRCQDPNHSPFWMTKHFAKLISNHLLCSLQ
jgi:hypothetical protein